MDVGWKKWKPDMSIRDQPRERMHETNADPDTIRTGTKRKTSGASSKLCASCDLLLPVLQKRNEELKIQLEKALQDHARRNYECETLAAKNHEQSKELQYMRKASEGNAQVSLLEIELLELKGQLADKTSECEFLERKNAKQTRELDALRSKRTGMPLPAVANLRVHAAGADRMEQTPIEANNKPHVLALAAEATEEALWDDILAPTDENRSAVMEALREKSKHASRQEPKQVWSSIASLVPHPVQAHRDAAFQKSTKTSEQMVTSGSFSSKRLLVILDVNNEQRDDVTNNYGSDE